MNQITLRGLSGRFMQEIKAEAKRLRKSVNQILLGRLLPKDENQDGDCAKLLKFTGTWDQKRQRDFEKALKDQRKIDKEMWL